MISTLIKMATGPDGDDGLDEIETGVATRTRPKTKKPSNYKVLMLNDDYTPMEFVVLVLQQFFSMGIEDATRVMLQVHQQGGAISGAKNAALTLMPCALLTDEKLTLANLPRLADVDTFSHLLNQLGVSTHVAGVKKGQVGRRMTLQADDVVSTVAPYDMVRKMRASVLVLGPM